ncbi:MAG: hypothetical protein R3Y27_08405 [Clostridia bacterium]
MADIKTHLRELSVAVAIGCLNTKKSFAAAYTPIGFMEIAKCTVLNDIGSADNILSLIEFNNEHISIIDNGLLLGTHIYDKFKITSNDQIIWLGNDTQKGDPVDLIIGNYSFSLKESSFILENMGLYKFLSLLTNKEYKRGLHVFEEFASNEYDAWFEYVWLKLINAGNWNNSYFKYSCSFSVEKNNVIFNFNDELECQVPISISTAAQFMQNTNTKVREKVFSKWISENLKKDEVYIRLKKLCSETAGKNICQLIKHNIDISNLARLLQFREHEYFYAKSTDNELKVFKVPCIHDYNKEIIVDNISYSVPYSQLNIITTIKNTITGNIFEIRNECRFSHGQFNGTPEAKMYYGRKGDLSIIYTAI